MLLADNADRGKYPIAFLDAADNKAKCDCRARSRYPTRFAGGSNQFVFTSLPEDGAKGARQANGND